MTRTATLPKPPVHTEVHDGPPTGHMYVWFATEPTREKVRGVFERFSIPYHVEDGGCVVAETDWSTMRAMVMPLRRDLTQMEANATSVLYKPDGGPLVPADFPKVRSYAQFAMVTESHWLEQLLAEERFTSVLQDIVYAEAPGFVFGHEALLRGFGRDDSIIHPGYLFDAARACGMLDRLELAARRAAIQRMVVDAAPGTLFINVTPSAIDDSGASLGQTIDYIDCARIPHGRVVFEIVESDQATNIAVMQRLLASHREAGFRVALDDVGAGYSGLTLLHQLRPDFIKLDMELIHGVTDDPYKALITRKILEIAADLGIESIAEGVETAAELDWVRTNGATYAQGYVISHPTTPVLAGRTPRGLT